MENNKTVIVTGCSSGIGKATAKLLKENGWRVFATARRKEDVSQLLGDGFESCQLDLESSSSISCALDFVLAKTEGKIYALVNTAGFEVIAAIEDITRDEIRKQFEVNVFGLQELTNRLIKIFRRQGFGRIIHISSLVGKIPLPFTGAYCASKFTLEALADAQSIELDKTNIYISLVELGPITQTNFDKNAIEKLYNKNTEESYHGQAYKNIINNTRVYLDKIKNNTAGGGDCPHMVAQSIQKILETKKPQMRYFIKPRWWIIWITAKILPQSILNLLIKRYRKDTF